MTSSVPTATTPAAPATATATATATDGTVQVNGLQLHYRALGDPAAPPLVFLHGIMGHCREWDVATAALARRFHVVAVDQRGHGASSWAPRYTAAALAGDAVALVDALGLGRVHLVGHSMGGMASYLVAADRPELVDRLVVIDVSPDTLAGDWGPTVLAPMLLAMSSASYAGPDEALAEWQGANPLARPDLLRHYVAHALVEGDDGRWRWGFDAAGLAGFVTEGAMPAELWAAVERIDVPTLFLRGQHSDLVTPAMAAEVVERLGHAHLVEVPGGGHDLGVEQPEAVATAILAFSANGQHGLLGRRPARPDG